MGRTSLSPVETEIFVHIHCIFWERDSFFVNIYKLLGFYLVECLCMWSVDAISVQKTRCWRVSTNYHVMLLVT